MRRFLTWLVPPAAGDEAHDTTTRFLRGVIVSIVLVIGCLLAARLTLGGGGPRSNSVLAVLLVFFAGLLVSTRWVSPDTVGAAGVLTGWAALTWMAWVGGGVNDGSVAAFAAVILMAGLVRKRLFTTITSGLCLFSVWFLAIAERMEFFRPSSENPLSFAGDVTASALLVTAIVILYSRSMRRSQDRITAELSERVKTEAALRESEARLRHISETITDGIGFAENGVVTDVNPQIADMLGYAPGEMLGREVMEFIAPESRELVKAMVASGSCGPYEYIALRKDGSTFNAECTARNISLMGRSFRATLMRDITGRKTRERMQRLTTEVLQALNLAANLNSLIREMLTLVRSHTGFDAVGLRLRSGDDFPYFEQSGFPDAFVKEERLLCARDGHGNISRDERGRPVLECTCGLVLNGRTDPSLPFFTEAGSFWTSKADDILSMPASSDPRANPRNNCIRAGYQSVALIPLRTPNGIMGLLQLNDRRKGMLTPDLVHRLEDMAASIAMAISRRQTEEQLRESQQRILLHRQQTPLGVIEWDTDFRVTAWNPAAERIFGYSKDEALGRHASELVIPEEAREHVDKVWADLLGQYGGKRSTNENVTKDGCTLICDWFNTPLVDESGNVVGVASLVLDITENRRLETSLQQARKMEAVGQLAGGVAHDFNNMLQAILGHAEMAQMQTAPDDPRRDDIAEILRTGKRAGDLTRQLLAFARKQTVAPRVLDLNDVVEGMLKMLRRLIGENIELVWTPQNGLWPVCIDPSQVDQILANLTVNARDAIEGAGRISISVANFVADENSCAWHADITPGNYVVMEVADTGCGMSAEVLSHLFEPFFTTKVLGKGTGMGLATVYGIVKQNNGFVDVESEPAKGASFRVYLPARENPALPNQEQEDRHHIPRARGETVLLVEDDPSILAMETRMLEKLGYKVIEADDPARAITIAAGHQGRIDLLISDVVLPHMSGRKMADRIRADRPDTALLFISGYAAEELSRENGADNDFEFLQKPFSLEALAVQVRRALSGHDAAR